MRVGCNFNYCLDAAAQVTENGEEKMAIHQSEQPNEDEWMDKFRIAKNRVRNAYDQFTL